MSDVRGYLVDWVGYGSTLRGDEGRTEPTARMAARPQPATQQEPEPHYNKLPLNYRVMDLCNERSRQGWQLARTEWGSLDSGGRGMFLFFEREFEG